MAKVKDLRPRAFPVLDKTAGNVISSLRSLSDFIEGEAEDAINWYLEKRKIKRILGRTLRLGAIFLTGFAALVPILGEIFHGPNGAAGINPLWGAVAIALAGSLILMDRFLGCTTGWIRYMKAGLELGKALLQYRLGRLALQSKWNSDPSEIQLSTFVESVRSFALQINDYVIGETTIWIAEFQTALQMVDESSRAAIDSRKPGAISVVVLNGVQCDKGWSVAIDDSPSENCLGTSRVFLGVQSGIHSVRVTATISSKPATGEKAVTVASGVVAEVQLTLT